MVGSSNRSIYGLGLLRRFAASAILWVFAIPLLALAPAEHDPDSRRALLVTGGFLLALGAGAYALSSYPRLVLSSAGVSLRQLGWTLETTWDNVVGIWVSDSRRRGVRGLVLKQPLRAEQGAALRLSLTRRYSRMFHPDEIRLIRERQYIPLQPFGLRFERGHLRTDLNRFAPAMRTETMGKRFPST